MIKIKILFLILICLCFLFFNTNIFAETYFFPAKDGFIYEDTNENSKVIRSFKKGEQFVFDPYSGNSDWCRVYDLRGEFLGYILAPEGLETIKIEENKPEVAKRLYEYRSQEIKEKQKEIEQKKKEIEQKISVYSPTIQKLIREGKIILKMTTDQVLLSWGKPEKINESVGVWGKNEQWVYGDSYLYFENGILTSYQTSKKP